MAALSARFGAFMFLRFVSRQLKPNVRGDRVSTRRDTLYGRSCGRKMQGGGKGRQQSSGRLKSQQEPAFCVQGKSLKKQRKAAMKWRGESGVLASDVARGKNSKTFQFLSFPFIASQAAENGVRGDPNISVHPPVNRARKA